MRTFSISFLAGLFCLFIVSCGDDNGSPTSGNGITPVQSSIGPEGGTIEMTGKVTLVVPTGALSDTVDFSIEIKESPTPLSPPLGFVSSAYTIEPTGTQFSPPAIIMINYSEQGMGGADEDSIKICTNDGSGWTYLTTTVNKPQNIATAGISHLSDFAAVADTTPPVNEGVFAALAVARTITVIDDGSKSIPFKMDGISARFDSAYSPCNPVTPLQPASVTCNQYTLTWQSMANMFSYSDFMNLEFVELGGWYVFNVVGSGGVPTFKDSIDFPTAEPYLTSPAANSTVSSTGFDVAWTGTGPGDIYLIFVEAAGQGDSALFVQTANDGSHSFSEAELSGLSPDLYGFTMVYENWDYIDAVGIDSRSFIRARVISTIQLTLQ